MPVNEKSALEMAHGAIIERVDYEMPKIIRNLLDVNTDPKKARELHITLKFITDADRKNVYMVSDVKPPKLAPTGSITSALYIQCSELGEMSIVELTPQVPGQIDLTGAEQGEPARLRLVEGGSK